MRHEDSPTQKKQVNSGYKGRNWILPFLPAWRLIWVVLDCRTRESGEMSAEEGKIENVGEHDSDDSLPAKLRHHEAHAPVPSLGDHQNGGRSKMSQGSANRHIDENNNKEYNS